MTNGKDNKPLTHNEISEFLRLLNKDSIKISPLQIETLYKTINKRLNYDADRLSETAKTELVKIYAFEMYGCGSISYGGNWIPVEKGILAEQSAIELLSGLDGIEYKKNDKLFKNAWFKGKPDIIIKDENKKVKKIIEIKIPTSLADYIKLLHDGIDYEDEWQMKGYLDILKCEQGEVVYCLVDMPKVIFDSEKQRILDVCNKVQASEDEIERRINQLYSNMHYDHINDLQKVIRFPIIKDASQMRLARNRVKIARTQLQKIHDLFQKPLILVQNNE